MKGLSILTIRKAVTYSAESLTIDETPTTSLNDEPNPSFRLASAMNRPNSIILIIPPPIQQVWKTPMTLLKACLSTAASSSTKFLSQAALDNFPIVTKAILYYYRRVSPPTFHQQTIFPKNTKLQVSPNNAPVPHSQ